MRNKFNITVILWMLILMNVNCKKTDPLTDPNDGEIIIEAKVPEFIYVNDKEFYLDATKTTGLNKNRKLTYNWTFLPFDDLSEPPHIELPDSYITRVNRLLVGIYSFQLKVRDDFGNLAKKNFDVEVLQDTIYGKMPIAFAGPDQQFNLPQNTALLDGSANYVLNPTGRNIFFSWTLISKPAGNPTVEFDGNDQQLCHVAPLNQGTYQFGLEIKNELGVSAYDTIQVNVQPDPLIGTSWFFEDAIWDWGKDIYRTSIILTINHPSLFKYRNSTNIEVRIWDEEKKIWSDSDYEWEVTDSWKLFIYYPFNNDPLVYKKELGKKAKVRVNIL